MCVFDNKDCVRPWPYLLTNINGTCVEICYKGFSDLFKLTDKNKCINK